VKEVVLIVYSDSNRLGGNAGGIIERCHHGKGVVWVSSRFLEDGGWRFM
jgi:hypothetical protein